MNLQLGQVRRVRYYVLHPLKAYRRKVYWPIRTFWDRGRRGWSVSDTWSFDGYIATVMSGGLRRLRTDAHGYPGNLTPEKWDAILTEMEEGFRRWSTHWDDPDEDEAYRKVQRSIRLMHRWFGHLWD